MATEFFLDGYNSYAGTDIVVTAQLAYIDDEELSKKCYTLGSIQTLSISTHVDRHPIRNIGNINARDHVYGQRTIAGSIVFTVFDRHWADEMFEDLKTYSNGAMMLSDELPALDFTIVFANEYGKKSRMGVYGIRFVDSGQVMSINDLYIENTFQFVATGLETLNPTTNEVSSSLGKSRNKVYIAGNNDNLGNLDLYNFNDKFNVKYNNAALNTIVPNDPTLDIKDKFSYTIIQPITYNGDGGIIIEKKEETSELKIAISDITENLVFSTDIDKTPWYYELGQGEYIITLTDEKDNQHITIDNVTIAYKQEKENVIQKPVVVEHIDNNSIQFLRNNIKHDKAIVVKSDDKNRNFTKDMDSDLIVINGLEEDTKYTIYTTDGTDISAPVNVSTNKSKFCDINLLIKYIKFNKPLWVSRISDVNLNDLYNDGHTLIDKVLKLNCDKIIKSEILIYAIKLQNELNKYYNHSSKPITLTNSTENIFNIQLKCSDPVKRITYYKVINNKNFYDKNVNNTSVISGAINTRYFARAVDDNNNRSLRYDFCCFDKETKEELDKYSEVKVLDSKDFTFYNDKYPNYDTELIKGIYSKEYFIPDTYILKEPGVLSYTEDEIVFDVNYIENGLNGTNYICISQINTVFDYTPVRKIPFENTTECRVKQYESNIYEDNYYLVWIEDSDFLKISESMILSTHTDKDTNFENYLLDSIKKYSKYKTNALASIFNNKELFDTLHMYILSYAPSFKNLSLKFDQELINLISTSSYSALVGEILFESLKLTHDSIKDDHSKVIYKDNILTFVNETNNCTLITIDYNFNENMPFRSMHDTLEINLKYHIASDFTVAYLVSDDMLSMSGFVLINRLTNDIYNYNISLEVKR